MRHSNPILLISHPGHELRLHGWLEQARPTVMVLTLGDGQQGVPRLASTTRILERTGARPGEVYGAMTDRDIYSALLLHEHPVFDRLLSRLVDAIVRADAAYVVADAEEGYNPSHDVCQYLAGAAAALASASLGRQVEVFDFLLVGAPTDCPSSLRPRARWILLDDEALKRKLAAADAYPELKGEVERALAAHGPEAFRSECLRPTTGQTPFLIERPFYERHGEHRVAAGTYPEVIRFAEHLAPLRARLYRAAEGPRHMPAVGPA